MVVPKDMINARKMALAMNVPEQQIIELRDSNATKANILAALDKLNRKVGARGKCVYLFFLVTGQVYNTGTGCEQGFIPFTEGRYTQNDLISEAVLAGYTAKISQKADKAVVMVDACFFGWCRRIANTLACTHCQYSCEIHTPGQRLV